MKVYIASHDQELAKEAAITLIDAGHFVTSQWLGRPFNRTATYTDKEKQAIADENISDLESSDALVLISGMERYPGGKFIEAGYAAGLNKPVVIIGRRENMQTWGSGFDLVDSAEGAAKRLAEIQASRPKDNGCPVCGL